MTLCIMSEPSAVVLRTHLPEDLAERRAAARRQWRRRAPASPGHDERMAGAAREAGLQVISPGDKSA
jgi:hypothetical protein